MSNTLADSQPEPAPQRRLLFFVGLEGSGHHFWSAATRRLVASGQLASSEKLSATLGRVFGAASRVRMRADSADVRGRRAASLELEKAKALAVSGLQQVSEERCKRLCPSVVLNTPRLRLSYPNGSPGSYPDAPLLASLCEGAGLDLRLVILMRDPADCLVSAARRFGGSAKAPPAATLSAYSKSMEHAMVTMSAQLDRLSGSTRPAYALFDEIGDKLQTRGLAHYAGVPFPVLEAAILEVSQKHPPNAKRARWRETGANLAPAFAGVYNLSATLQPFSRFGFERALSVERL